jgi:hypothetical protein
VEGIGCNHKLRISSDKPLLTVDHISASGLETSKAAEGSPTVRFASVNEEIAPDNQTALDFSLPAQGERVIDDQRIRELSQSLQGSHLQGRRMSHFAFEPVSLPASRVCQLRFLSIVVRALGGEVGMKSNSVSTHTHIYMRRCLGILENS